MRNFLEKFVRFNPNYSIHQIPVGGFLFRSEKPTPHNLTGTYINIPKDTWFINSLAVKFFSKCDGKTKLKEILHKIYKGDIWESCLDSIKSFLQQAVADGDISFLSSPNPVEVTITGSEKAFFPLHLACELTYKCQLKCVHCYAEAGGNSSNRFIPLKKMREILQSLWKKGLRVIELTGGEPLLYSDLWPLLEFCVSLFDYVALLTNGTSITEKVAKEISIYRNKVLVNVSLDGSSSKIHDYYRGIAGAFDKTIKGIKLLVENGLFVRVTMSVYPDTIKEIEPTLLLAQRLGAKTFVWGPALPFGRGKNVIWNKEKNELLGKIGGEVFSKYKNFIQWVPKEKARATMKFSNCGAGWKSVVLDPEGDLRPCLYLSKNYLNLGNLLNNTPDEIFSKEIFFTLYNLLSAREEICGECGNLLFCEFCFVRPIALCEKSKRKLCKWMENQNITSIFKIDKQYEEIEKCN